MSKGTPVGRKRTEREGLEYQAETSSFLLSPEETAQFLTEKARKSVLPGTRIVVGSTYYGEIVHVEGTPVLKPSAAYLAAQRAAAGEDRTDASKKKGEAGYYGTNVRRIVAAKLSVLTQPVQDAKQRDFGEAFDPDAVRVRPASAKALENYGEERAEYYRKKYAAK